MPPELSSAYFGGTASVLFAYVLPLATAGLSALRRGLHARSARMKARDARRAAEAEAATLDVGDTVLHGSVEYAQGQDHAVAVHVEQYGSEAESSGSWTVTWTEKRRTIDVAPFYVVHHSGARVRVEPDKDTRIASPLPTFAERHDNTLRTRTATIMPNVEVWVTGQLTKDNDPENAGGYRGSPGWVMRPPLGRREPMWVSTEPPEGRLLKDASRSRWWMAVYLVLFMVMIVSHTRYHALAWMGQPATAIVTGKHTESDSDGDTSAYILDVRVGTGPSAFTDKWDVRQRDHALIGQGETFPAIAVFGPLATSEPAGPPHAGSTVSIILLVIWLVLAIIARVRDCAKAWYDGAAVVDTESGRL